MSTQVQRAYRLVKAAGRLAKTREGCYRVENVQIHVGYAEPGYDSDAVVALGNWNNCTRYDRDKRESVTVDSLPSRLAKALERMGVELEWDDEWTQCADCGKLVRTQANSYGWTQSYWDSDDGAVCHECLKADPSAYLESLEGNASSADTMSFDLTEHGYEQVETDLEHGFHSGQDASPTVIAESLAKRGVTRFIFQIDDVGQFDISFSLYVHEDDLDAYNGAAEPLETDGPSVSGAMERALREASSKLDRLPSDGDGVKVVTCNGDGTADVRLVSREDFIEGRALKRD